jgi:hypothetical protein
MHAARRDGPDRSNGDRVLSRPELFTKRVQQRLDALPVHPKDPADDLSSDPRSASGADPVVDRPVRLRLPRPRPALRRLVRQPRFVAAGAVTLVVAVRLAGFLKNGVRGQKTGSDTESSNRLLPRCLTPLSRDDRRRRGDTRRFVLSRSRSPRSFPGDRVSRVKPRH